MITDTRDHLISFTQLLGDAETERSKINLENVCKYGIDVLDAYMGGILPNELVVVGADTGIGKSELAYKIAITNAMRGKKVLLLSLEGDLHEIALRYTQKVIADVTPIKTIEYRFNLKEEHKKYATDVMTGVHDQERGENLFVFNKKEVPTFGFISELIHVMRDTVDMIIIDHLNYIQFADSASEITEIGKVMREVKQITDTIRKPIIMMSHLRKRDKDKDPTSQDLYGSSNIAKEANTVILLTKMDKFGNGKFTAIDTKEKIDRKELVGTKIIIAKSRTGLPVPSSFAMIYDLEKKDYLDKFGCLIEEESNASINDNINFTKI